MALYNKSLLIMLILITTIAAGLLLFKKYNQKNQSEAFTQNQPFVAKYDQEIYDIFYSEVYDSINKPHRRVPHELKTIMDSTQVSDKSVFLDVGSGTGHVVKELSELGYDAYGIDNAKAMVDYSERIHSEIAIKRGDVMDPMVFEKGVFTHILCLYYTVYQFKDKRTFFRNCYYWLRPGGYLVVHLADNYKNGTTIPVALDPIFGSTKHFKEEQSRDNVMDFYDFQYKTKFSYNETNKQLTFTETFTDKASRNTRQNEQTFYMDTTRDILSIANANGFIPHAKFSINNSTNDDEEQYLYIFERAL